VQKSRKKKEQQLGRKIRIKDAIYQQTKLVWNSVSSSLPMELVEINYFYQILLKCIVPVSKK